MFILPMAGKGALAGCQKRKLYLSEEVQAIILTLDQPLPIRQCLDESSHKVACALHSLGVHLQRHMLRDILLAYSIASLSNIVDAEGPKQGCSWLLVATNCLHHGSLIFNTPDKNPNRQLQRKCGSTVTA